MKINVKTISVCVSVLFGISVLRSLFYRLWDPEYTKLTLLERKRLERSEEEMAAGIYFTEEDIQL